MRSPPAVRGLAGTDPLEFFLQSVCHLFTVQRCSRSEGSLSHPFPFTWNTCPIPMNGTLGRRAALVNEALNWANGLELEEQ